MAKSCKLPKAVTDAAIPRRVRAVCELIAGRRHFFVRGDDGRPGRIFSTGAAFARHIKGSYGLRGSDRVRDLDVFGHKFRVDAEGNTRRVTQSIDTKRSGDYGADPVGDGTFKMVPSGDIVSSEERNRRLNTKLRGASRMAFRGGRPLTDLSPELIEINTDYLHTATNLRPLVTGQKANRILGYGGQWTGKVVGDDPETGAQVTVAWYGQPYEATSAAKKRAADLLRYVRSKR